MTSPAEEYDRLLGPMLHAQTNFDPYCCKVRLGDFGIIIEGEFQRLLNLIEPEPRAQYLLSKKSIEQPPHWLSPPSPPIQLQWRVDTSPRERCAQGIIARGAVVSVREGLLRSDQRPEPSHAPVTITPNHEKSAMLSLEEYERRVERLDPADEALAVDYLERNREAILDAFRRRTWPESRFVTQVELCYGYSNALMRIGADRQTVTVELGLFSGGNGASYVEDVCNGCLRRTAKQATSEGREWKYVYAFRGPQWYRWNWMDYLPWLPRRR